MARAPGGCLAGGPCVHENFRGQQFGARVDWGAVALGLHLLSWGTAVGAAVQGAMSGPGSGAPSSGRGGLCMSDSRGPELGSALLRVPVSSRVFLRLRLFGQHCLMSSPPRPNPTFESRAEDRPGRLCRRRAWPPLCGGACGLLWWGLSRQPAGLMAATLRPRAGSGCSGPCWDCQPRERGRGTGLGLGLGLGKKLVGCRPRSRAGGLCPATWGQGHRSVHTSIGS